MRTSWSTVDTGLFVASRDGDFIDYVDKTARGVFVACDEYSTLVGKYDSLEKAQQAVIGAVPKPAPKPGRVAPLAASVTRAIAGTLLLTAGALVPHL